MKRETAKLKLTNNLSRENEKHKQQLKNCDKAQRKIAN